MSSRLFTLLAVASVASALGISVAAAPSVPRAAFARVHLLGRSWKGRPIRAVELGDPQASRKVLVVACIHGNECAGLAVVHELEAAPTPRGVDLWIVPDLNPDGFAAGTRQNGRGVDLNRNFDWKWFRQGRPFGTFYTGPRALSERESRIATRLILRIRPAVSIWYHQHMDLVRSGGGSAAAGRRYARLVGMAYRTLAVPTGAATGWQTAHFPHTSAFVVELPAGRLDTAAARLHARAVLRLAAG